MENDLGSTKFALPIAIIIECLAIFLTLTSIILFLNYFNVIRLGLISSLFDNLPHKTIITQSAGTFIDTSQTSVSSTQFAYDSVLAKNTIRTYLTSVMNARFAPSQKDYATIVESGSEYNLSWKSPSDLTTTSVNLQFAENKNSTKRITVHKNEYEPLLTNRNLDDFVVTESLKKYFINITAFSKWQCTGDNKSGGCIATVSESDGRSTFAVVISPSKPYTLLISLCFAPKGSPLASTDNVCHTQ